MVNDQDFINSAEKLLILEPSEEMNYRNAISRAYYALFHHGSLLCADINHKIIASSHKAIVETLDAKHPKTSSQLDKLRKMRIKADYRLNETISRYDAERAVKQARSALDELISDN